MKKQLLALLLIGTLFAQSGIALAAEIDVGDSAEIEEVAEEIVVSDSEDTEEAIEPVEAEEAADESQETESEETVAEESVQAITVEDGEEFVEGIEGEEEDVVDETPAPDNGKCGDNLTWSYSNGVLKIGGTGPMYAFYHWDSEKGCNVGARPPWDQYNDEIKSVQFGSGVTTIGHSAFEYCHRIKKVVIPENITRIGEFAFRSYYPDSKLEEITILNKNCKFGDGSTSAIEPGVTIIGYIDSTAYRFASSYYWDYRFCDIETNQFIWKSASGESDGFSWTLQDGTMTIRGKGTLPDSWANSSDGLIRKYWGQFNNLVIGEGLTSLGDRVLASNNGLQSVTLPKSLTTITPYAFYRCNNLREVHISEGVKRIGEYAFGNCAIETIQLPNSLKQIDANAFYYCEELEGIDIPEGVTSVGKNAFIECGSLKNVTIPSTLKKIENGTFYLCGLTSIVLPAGVTSIGDSAFSNCRKLISVKLPSTVTSIGIDAFNECWSLESINIPSGLTKIENGTFCGCRSLKSITIPSSVTSIGAYAFDGCHSLEQSVVQTVSARITDDGNKGVISAASVSVNRSRYYTFPKTTTLYGYTNSTTYKYAKKHGRAFRAFNTPYLSKSTFTYNGKVQKPDIVIYGSNGKKISSGSYKAVWPSGCKNVGKYTVKLTYKGKTTSQSFTINPKSTAFASLASGSQSFTVKWTKQPTQTSGYQLRYATNSKFTGAKTVTIASTKTTSKKITGLKDATKYYVQIRTYKTVSGKKYYPNWSSAKTVTTKAPVPKATSLTSVTAASKGFTAKWSKQTTQTTGYQLQYSTSSKFTGAKTVWITSNKTTSKKISGLTAKKKYYVRIRTYKTLNGKKYYSSWSKTKTVTTKK